MKTNDWAEIPKGLCIIRMFHERTGKHCLHLQMKLNDGPWYDQPQVPVHSQGAGGYHKFWEWAENTLPTWEYPDPVKAHP